jgi:hypothetical protein
MAGPYPSDQGSPAGAIPVYITSGSGGSGSAGTLTVQNAPQAGISAPSGTAGTASSVILPAATLKGCCCIQNTSANGETLYIAFGRAATTADFAIADGGSIFLHFGPTNDVYGLGSDATTTYAIIGY